MKDTVDVFWSFRSPYSYLAIPDLLRLREDYNVEVRLRTVLPLALRNPTAVFDPSNMKPAVYLYLDSKRRSEFLGMPFVFPPTPDPVVQNFETFQIADEQPYIYRLSKLGIEAERRGKGLDLANSVSRLIFSGTKDWDQGNHLENAVAEAGMDLAELDSVIDNGDHLEEVERNHEALDAAGHWGVPTMVFRGEPFFGQDRVDTLRWRLDQFDLQNSMNP